jgi:hypothetical protein
MIFIFQESQATLSMWRKMLGFFLSLERSAAHSHRLGAFKHLHPAHSSTIVTAGGSFNLQVLLQYAELL